MRRPQPAGSRYGQGEQSCIEQGSHQYSGDALHDAAWHGQVGAGGLSFYVSRVHRLAANPMVYAQINLQHLCNKRKQLSKT
jgi:hypothetical protein